MDVTLANQKSRFNIPWYSVFENIFIFKALESSFWSIGITNKMVLLKDQWELSLKEIDLDK